MPVYLDDQPVSFAAADVGGILDAAARQLTQRGRIVAQVELGGRILEPPEIVQRRSQPLGGEDLRLLSADPRELVVSSIPQVREELTEARRLQVRVAQLLQQDRRGQALAQLPNVLTIWQRAQELLGYALTVAGESLESLQVDGRAAPQLVGELAELLRSARQMIENGDSVALADALAYEWPATAERWDRMLQVLAQRLQES